MPRLLEFYGGDPERWLHVPQMWLRAFAMMLPRLQAERQLRAVEAAIAADPLMEPQQRRRMIEIWQRMAGGGAPRRTRERPLSREEFEQRMAALGMIHA